MAIATGSLIEISLLMAMSGQQMYNVWQYYVRDFTGIPSAGELGAAWWNHVKDDYRAAVVSGIGNTFVGVKCLELNVAGGEYGEYAVPVGEATGTRTPPASPQLLPTFNAVGVRLTVPARTTRPGQKRFPFVTESDVVYNTLDSGLVTLVNTLMDTMTGEMVLGAPALGVVLAGAVVSKGTGSTIDAFQIINGYVTNAYVTSQVSRKQGRGI